MTPVLTTSNVRHFARPVTRGRSWVVDPTTETAYVLIRADIFEAMQSLIGDFDICETYAAQEAVRFKGRLERP